MTLASSIHPDDRMAFYAAAIAGLSTLDAAGDGRGRLGSDADVRWRSFKGGLTAGDRVDLLLRDAAVTWGAAFSPAEAFGLFGLAPDEPFGPDWQPLSDSVARRLLESHRDATKLDALGERLGIEPTPVNLPAVSASTRLAVAGGAALIAVARKFSSDPALSWSDQVLAIAKSPAHRQLASLLAIYTGSPSRTRLTRPSEDLRATITAAGFAQLDSAVLSPDAEPGCADLARRAAGVA